MAVLQVSAGSRAGTHSIIPAYSQRCLVPVLMGVCKVTATELTKDIQFTVDQAGHVTAVVLTPTVWRQILSALEDSEDRQLLASLQSRLAAGPLKSGALRFEDVTGDWQ